MTRSKPLDIYALMNTSHLGKIIRANYPEETGGIYQLEDQQEHPTNKRWKELLHKVYTGSADEDDDYILADNIRATDTELLEATQYLTEQGLVSMPQPHRWDITPEGIDVASLNEKQKWDKRIQILTIRLAVVAIIVSIILAVIL